MEASGTSNAFKEKFVEEYEALTRRVQAYRELGHCIVLTSGTFDLLHIGHHRYCEEARKKAAGVLEYSKVALVVGIDSDESVRKRKGEGRPLVPELERAEMMCAMETVNLVTIAREEVAQWKLMEAVRPNVLIISARVNVPDERRKKYLELCDYIVELESQATTSSSAKLRLAVVAATNELSGKYGKVMEAVKAHIGAAARELEEFAQDFERIKRGGGAE